MTRTFKQRLGLLKKKADVVVDPGYTPPVNLTLPTISGGTVAGTHTLTRTAGTYSGNPAPTLSGQWMRGGVAIAGETASTYVTVDPTDVGRVITYLESAVNVAGTVQVSSLAHTMDSAAPALTTPSFDWSNATVKNVNSTATSVVIDKPAGLVVGNVLVFFGQGVENNGAGHWIEHADFTQILDHVSSTSDNQLTVQWREIDGTEPASYTFTSNITAATTRLNGLLVQLQDCDPADLVNFILAGGTFTGSSSIASTGSNTDENNCLVISLMGFFGTDGVTCTVSGTGWAKAKEVIGGNTSGNGGLPLLEIAEKEVAVAGASGTCTFTTAVADRGYQTQIAFNGRTTGGAPSDFPIKIGTLTPDNNDASAVADGDTRTGFRANGQDTNFGSSTGGPFNFSELWARATGTPFTVDDMRAGSQLPLAKINNAESLRIGLYDPLDGSSLGPFTLPWEPAFNRYGANVLGSAAYITSKEGVALDLHYEEVAPTINAPRFEGFGAATTGGQGGRVIYVTDGGNSGAGTLRDALGQTGPRVILFKVNDIVLTSQIVVSASQGDFSMYGESAGGVQVRPHATNMFAGDGEALIKFRCSNYIMRGMKLRPGNAAALDSISIGSGTSTAVSENVVIDHNSFEWGVDENLDIGGNLKKATISNNIISQGLRNSGIHSKGVAHSMGVLFIAYGGGSIFPEQVSAHKNLLSHNVGRNPWMKQGKQIEWENNFVHGPGCDNSRYGQFGNNVATQSGQFAINCTANIRGNLYQKASDSGSTTNGLTLNNSGTAMTCATDDNVFKRADGSSEPTSYSVGSGVTHLTSSLAFTSSGYTPMASSAVKAHVLANAGAFPASPDAVDAAILSKANLGDPGIIDTQATMGGWPSIAFTPKTDTDGDGIPDEYEGVYATVEDYVDALIAGEATP